MESNLYRACPVGSALTIEALYTFSCRRFPDGYTFKGETHDFAEAVCVTDGKAGITAGKNVCVLSAGQMILHPPGEFHAIWSDGGAEPETVIFSFRAALPELPVRVFSLSPEKIGELRSIYRAAETAFILKENNVERIREGKETEASAVVKRLEIFLLSVFSGGSAAASRCGSRSAENYTRILSAMENNMGEPLDAETLARLCNMSVPALEKTVRRYSGCGAMAHYNALRMQRAAEMLSAGASVKETALSLGFSNQNYFSACFKKWSGKAPSSVRPAL